MTGVETLLTILIFVHGFGIACMVRFAILFARALAVSTTLTWVDETGASDKTMKLALSIGEGG